MRLWPQSSQRSTWPPRAAVRQVSMADIALSWPRLRCPAWAVRQAAPWRWKMSATSSEGGSRPPGQASGLSRPVGSGAEPVERAHHGADRVGGDAGIKGGGVELGVSEQDLDHADVDVLLQQMRGEAVAQRVRRDPLPDPGGLGGGMDGAVELARGERG